MAEAFVHLSYDSIIMPSILRTLLQHTIDALPPLVTIPFGLRLRLLAFHPLAFLSYALVRLPYQLSRKPYKIFQVPLPQSRGGGSIRCLVFSAPSSISHSHLKPLHISIHGSAFAGGFAENTASFCDALS
jgi:hypothetical protein